MNLDMTKGSPLKLILKFLVPVLLGCLFQQLYNMVDTIIVGKGVGSDALAAVGATGTIVFFILGQALLFCHHSVMEQATMKGLERVSAMLLCLA